MIIPTIDDVANAAGVSKSTVSRVLAGNTTYIREETRQRVLEAIKQLGYRPSSVARSLKSKRTQTIGFLASDVTNPFYAEVFKGVEDVAIINGYNVYLCNANYEPDRGFALINSLIDRRVDGALLMASIVSQEWLDALIGNNIPVVIQDLTLLDNEQKSKHKLKSINVNIDVGVSEAVEHLYQLGHRKFAHVSGPLHLATSRVRRDAFVKALNLLGIPSNSVQIIEGNYKSEGGRKAFVKLSESADFPTAIFTANDLTALGIMTEARSRGYKIPEDFSLVGLDDIWLAQESDPPLTTVAVDCHEFGAKAMEMLVTLMKITSEQQVAEPFITNINTHLVVRGSTTTPRK